MIRDRRRMQGIQDEEVDEYGNQEADEYGDQEMHDEEEEEETE